MKILQNQNFIIKNSFIQRDKKFNQVKSSNLSPLKSDIFVSFKGADKYPPLLQEMIDKAPNGRDWQFFDINYEHLFVDDSNPDSRFDPPLYSIPGLMQRAGFTVEDDKTHKTRTYEIGYGNISSRFGKARQGYYVKDSKGKQIEIPEEMFMKAMKQLRPHARPAILKKYGFNPDIGVFVKDLLKLSCEDKIKWYGVNEYKGAEVSYVKPYAWVYTDGQGKIVAENRGKEVIVTIDESQDNWISLIDGRTVDFGPDNDNPYWDSDKGGGNAISSVHPRSDIVRLDESDDFNSERATNLGTLKEFVGALLMKQSLTESKDNFERKLKNIQGDIDCYDGTIRRCKEYVSNL